MSQAQQEAPEILSGNTNYIPTSLNPFSLKVQMPSSMAFETMSALLKISQLYGDIDRFVMNALNYKSKQDLYKALAAEQIDSVAMAIHQIQAGQGLIIGDQTGIGKGRQAAAIIRYAVVNGLKCIFLTKTPDLLSDMWRDLSAIGFDNVLPYILQTDANANLVDNEVDDDADENAKVFVWKKKNDVRYKVVTSNSAHKTNLSGNKLPSGYDCVFSTYSQFSMDYDSRSAKILAKMDASGGRGKKELDALTIHSSQYKCDFLRDYAKNAIIVLDEAHMASGEGSAQGFFFRELVASSKGVLYLSATYAKRPDNMPLYSLKTAISEAGLSSDSLSAAFEKGGVALQEVVAADLVKSGQMVRRQRSYDGIKVEYITLENEADLHFRIYDNAMGLVRKIIDFQDKYAKPTIAEIAKSMAFSGASAKSKSGTEEAGLNSVDIFSTVHNLRAQLLFSIKAAAVADFAVKLLEQDKKVVIAFSSTMAQFLESLGLKDGDEVENADYSLRFKETLNSVMSYTMVNEMGVSTSEVLDPKNLENNGYSVYQDIVTAIEELSLNVSISPIDILINRIESVRRPNEKIGGNNSKFYRVRECTGRKAQIKIEGGVPVYRRFKADKKLFFKQFNNGDADVLLINKSAATGVSCHASIDFKDTRQRAMIIHQPELDINEEIQKRGRINRTGQVVTKPNGESNLPEYYYISTAIPCEVRELMVLKKKLKSLDANTTGNQRSSQTQLSTEDFFNKYGGSVCRNYINEHPELEEEGYIRVRRSDTGTIEEPLEGLPMKMTNHLSIAPVDVQRKVLSEINAAYSEYLAELKQDGTYDLELEFLPYDAELLSRHFFTKSETPAKTVFGKNSIKGIYDCKVLKKPYSLKTVNEKIEELLDGQTAQAYNADIKQAYEFAAKDKIKLAQGRLDNSRAELENDIAKAKSDIATIVENIQELDKSDSDEDKTEGKKTKVLKLLEAKLAIKKELLDKLESSDYQTRFFKSFEERLTIAKLEYNRLVDCLNFFVPGRAVVYPQAVLTGMTLTSAIVIGIKINSSSSNPFAPSSIKLQLALCSSDQRLDLPLSRFQDLESILSESKRLPADYVAQIKTNWDTQLPKGNKQKRAIVTGNILRALNRANELTEKVESLGGIKYYRIMKFSTDDEAIHTGIELVGVNAFQKASSVNISAASSLFKQKVIPTILATKSVIVSHDVNVFKVMVNQGNNYKPIWSSVELNKLSLGGKFSAAKAAAGSKFEAFFAYSDLDDVFRILGGLGVTCELDVAFEEEREEVASLGEQGEYAYKGIAPYVPNKMPNEYLLGANPEYAAGYFSITYSYPLSAKVKSELRLIPLLSPKQAVEMWLKRASPAQLSSLRNEASDLLGLSYDKALRRLALFAYSNSGEPCNPEYTFGENNAVNIGEEIYLALFGESYYAAALKIEIQKLKIVL